MSYDDPEEELLDQHLREAFSEFELPPANRVWKGIEGRIGTLPGAAQPLLPLKFLLPAVALAGVAAGWILSPATLIMPAPKPTVAYMPPPSQAAPASPMMEGPASVSPAQISLTTLGTDANANRQRWAAPNRLTRLPAIAPLASLLPKLALASGPAAALLVPGISGEASVYRDTVPAVNAEPLVGSEPVATQPSVAAEMPKADGPKGFHAEFRQPTHRRAEKGRGIRRRLSAVGRWARHLVSPHRTRTIGQPNF